MPAYLVAANANAATHRIEGVDTMVVFAANADTAKEIAKARYTGDSDAVWAAATVTEITAATNWVGWEFRARLFDTDGDKILDLNFVAQPTDHETIDQIGTAMAAAINAASDDIANAAYNASTNILSVAGSSDSLGDHTLNFTIKPPAAQNQGDVNISELVGAIVDGGASGDAVTVALPADATVVPRVVSVGKRS